MRQVVVLAAGREAAVLLGDRQPEAADLGEARDDVLGDVDVVAVDVLGDRADLVLGEAAEGVLHQLEVVVEVAWARRVVGQRGQERRGAVGGDELREWRRGRRARRPTRPRGRSSLPARSGTASATNAQVEARLDVALGAVVEQARRRLDGGRGVGEVVGEHLVGVDATLGGRAWRWPASTTPPARSMADAAAVEVSRAAWPGTVPTARPVPLRHPVRDHATTDPSAATSRTSRSATSTGTGPARPSPSTTTTCSA